MSAELLALVFTAYSLLLFAVVWFTSRKASNHDYFIGSRSSHWGLVAYGMIGASLSGVTFMSVPGDVFNKNFTYFQVVMGYVVGYAVIAFVLMPVYYKMQLTSIYAYLGERFGAVSHRTGSAFFLLSRIIGAAFRMFIVINVLQEFIFDAFGVPFLVTVSVFMVLILLYTFKGGVKTIIWTDTLQTTFMLLALVYTVWLIAGEHTSGISGILNVSKHTTIFNWSITDKDFFWKDFLGGAAVAIAMTGLDQEMMQKNLSCKNLKEAQKNMISFTTVLVFVNFLFLVLGAMLVYYAGKHGMAINPKNTDALFPSIALKALGLIPGLIFLIGLISAAYPSADGALTSLTTVFCFDFLKLQDKKDKDASDIKRSRQWVHLSFAVVLLAVIVVFKAINNDAVVRNLFTAATYTYGPLLGLFTFGMLTKRKLNDTLAWLPCILSPIICWFLAKNSVDLFGGYKFGFELLLVNAAITFLGLGIISKKPEVKSSEYSANQSNS
ncbi:MAG: sodium:solute symporter [Bacteroidia bacterium]|jgi:Na+/proline symporter